MFSVRLVVATAAICTSALPPGFAFAADESATAEIVLEVGEEIAEFKLMSSAGEEVKLSEVTKETPVVLIVMRGFPGYQCPLCTRQVQEIVSHRKELAAKNAQVLLLYPGPGRMLEKQAREFIGKSKLPDNIRLLLDPDLMVTKTLGLRWDEEGETSYPSTLIIDQSRVLRFMHISKSHGDRTPVATVLEELGKLSK